MPIPFPNSVVSPSGVLPGFGLDQHSGLNVQFEVEEWHVKDPHAKP